MRIAVFLLVLCNLLFFAWARGVFGVAGGEAFRAEAQLHPERVRIVSNDVPPPETARREKSPPQTEPELCVLLSDLAATEAESAEARLSEKLPVFRVARTQRAAAVSYWVYIPPLKNKREADSKVAELKKLGIKDYYLVQESGANNLAISLGLFSTEAAAETALESLKESGVRTARVLERAGKAPLAQIELRGPAGREDELRRALAEILPEIRSGECPPRVATP